MQETISEERFREIADKAFPGPSRVISVSVLHWSASILVRAEYPVTLPELSYLAEVLHIPTDHVKIFVAPGINRLDVQIDLDPETPIDRPPLEPLPRTARLTTPRR